MIKRIMFRARGAARLIAVAIAFAAFVPSAAFAATALTGQMASVSGAAYAGTGAAASPYKILVAPNAFCAPSSFWANGGTLIPAQLALAFEQRAGNTDAGTLITSWGFDLADRNATNLNETWTNALRLCPVIGYSTSTGTLRFAISSKGDFSPFFFNKTTLKLNANYMTSGLGAKQFVAGDKLDVQYYGGRIASQTSRGTNYTVNLSTTDTSTTYLKGATVDTDGFITIDSIPNGGNYQVGYDLGASSVSTIPVQLFTGAPVAPALAVTLGGTTLVQGTDYTVAFSDNASVGTATVTVTGIGDYIGTVSSKFVIRRPLGSAIFDPISPQTFSGAPLTPSVSLTDSGTSLVEGVDYTLSYSGNVHVGAALVTASGIGNYAGSTQALFLIEPKSIAACVVSVDPSAPYTGLPITPNVTVTDGQAALTQGTDFTVDFTDNTQVGTATVTVMGVGDYAGATATSFRILRPIEAATFAPIPAQLYTGAPLTPALTVTDGINALVEGTDFTVDYENNTEAGTATVNVDGIGEYTGSTTATFRIVRSIGLAAVAPIPTQLFTGSALTPAVKLTDGARNLAEGADFTVSYADNTQVGTATVTITGLGDYTGSAFATFAIVPKSLASCVVSLPATETYTGSPIVPTVTVKDADTPLVPDTDYTLTFEDNTSVGTATVAVRGVGGYAGTILTTFTIEPKPLGSGGVSVPATQTYTGSPLTPAVTVTDGVARLAAGTDYSVACADNTHVGTATLSVTGMGNYTGSLVTTFAIGPKSITTCSASVAATAAYTGVPITPDVIVSDGARTLAAGTDFTVTYSDNKSLGEARVTIAGVGDYAGTTVAHFQVVRSIGAATIGAISAQIYTGSPIAPALSVKDGETTLVAGVDYDLSFVDNTVVGTATVTVTGAGDYVGSRTTTFVIVHALAGVAVAPIRAQTYTGSAITPALTVKDGGKTLVSGVDYSAAFANNIRSGRASVTVSGRGTYVGVLSSTFLILPMKVTGVKASSSSRRIKLTWSKAGGAAGYQVLYALAKNGPFRNGGYTVGTNRTLTGLKRGRNYFIVVRPYVVVDGGKAFGAASPLRALKVR